MFTAIRRRSKNNTTAAINDRRQRQTETWIVRYANAKPGEIRLQLRRLNREWDIERYLEMIGLTVSLVGLTIGFVKRKRKWFLIPAFAQSFLLQHALHGWFPRI